MRFQTTPTAKHRWMTLSRSLLLSTALGCIATLTSQSADARVISNTALASWDASNGNATMQSNTVDLQVYEYQAPVTGNIFAISGANSGGQNSLIEATGCRTANGGSGGGVFDISSPGAVSLAAETQFTAGQMVAFGIHAPDDNRDANLRDTLDVVIRTSTGDEEHLTLREDATNSGFFVGYLPSVEMPPPLQQSDCRLSVRSGVPVDITIQRESNDQPLATASASFLVDPYGTVFDSGNGAPVTAVRVTLINAQTGQPAQVYGADGVSAFPNSMISGSTVTDSSGVAYAFSLGDYRFPFVAPGTYRLLVEPAAPYTWASTASPAQLAALRNPQDGLPYTITDGSYGRTFELVTPSPVRLDVPVDHPLAGLDITKTASEEEAVVGDVIQYRVTIRNADATRASGLVTITDDLPRAMRLRPDTVRFNGVLVTPTISEDGQRLTVNVSGIAAGTSGLLTYIGEVRPDAQPGDAINTVIARDAHGTTSNRADANVRIRRDILGERLTVVGRLTVGGCSVGRAEARGIGGVRVMMQDGSFAVTDRDGRYHFEGVRPGTHVVQIDPSTLPSGTVPVDCARNTRSAGSAISRFAEGRGGELIRADFYAAETTAPEAINAPRPQSVTRLAAPVRPSVVEDAEAAGGTMDFFAGRSAGIDWIFPTADHNPRSPAIRVALSHLPDQTVVLTVNGEAVNALNFDGAQTAPDRTFKVSSWRGLGLRDGENHVVARVVNADGSEAARLERTVSLSGAAMNVDFVRSHSLLVADGLNRPVIAVRLTDRNGHPVRNGVTGDFTVEPPHRAALGLDTQQERQFTTNEQRNTTWHVVGDDGLAFIELDPTTASGTARLNFSFRSDQVTRKQQVDVWLNPGDRPWTIVGFAAGTAGYSTLDDHMDTVAESLPSDNVDGRIALYAKGRIRGDWLLTLAYDSDKEGDEARFGGVIDPRAYYTIYADRSDQGQDAASVRNLYLRLERPQFYALFGDFETAINEPELARYQRALNGGRAEYRGRNFAATAFVADTPYRHRRDELQGNGLTGPYQLGARDILANSERVVVEVRDRLRSDIVISSQTLTRHVDYDIDYFAGTLRFRQPILSRDADLNPQFIIADYEVDGVGERVLNAGGRISWTNDAGSLRVGGTFIHDENGTDTTNLAGIDLRMRPSPSTEVRAEFAASENSGDDERAHAWLVEAEHHGQNIDLLAYARERSTGFGVSQLSTAGESSRRFGFDGTFRFARNLSLTASAWQENYLARDAQRRAVRLLGEWKTQRTSLRAGLTHADDQLSDGARNRSTIVQLGGSQRLFDQRLELSAQTEFALNGENESVDFPARHTFGARWAISNAVALVGAYEIANGGTVNARTVRAGFDLQPWTGSRINIAGATQNLAGFGARSFAAYGLNQSFRISENVSIDASIDGQRTLSGIRYGDVMDPAHPVASGGFISGDGNLTEDFLALTAGANYRNDHWTVSARGEYRDGETVDRYGATASAIRRIGDGRAVGALLTWTRSNGARGVSTETLNGEISWAIRPGDSAWSFLNKTEVRLDSVENAVAGEPGPIGGPALEVSGDVRSQRIINSMAINYTPMRQQNGFWFENGTYSLFWGMRWSSNRFGDDDVKGWSSMIGGDWRFDVSDRLGLGAAGNVRIGTDARAITWSAGPQMVFVPMNNANFIIGYNFNGYRDRDFEAARYSRSGVYVTFRLKFDQTLLQAFGG
jgi:uncharacterized repeat protein (TIGR01451 family)